MGTLFLAHASLIELIQPLFTQNSSVPKSFSLESVIYYLTHWTHFTDSMDYSGFCMLIDFRFSSFFWLDFPMMSCGKLSRRVIKDSK